MAQLTSKQQRAIAALLVETDQGAAAGAAGISRRTLVRWLAESDFRAAYQNASNARLWDTIGQLRTATGEAVATLKAALKSQSDTVKVRAACALLEIAIKADNDILAMRIDALEEQNRRMLEHGTRPAASHR